MRLNQKLKLFSCKISRLHYFVSGCFYRIFKFIIVNLLLVARTCSLIFIVLDVLKPLGDKKLIERELEGFGIRLNKRPPNMHFKTKDKGGVNFQTMVTVWLLRC